MGVPLPRREALIALLFIGCVSGSVLHVDVVGATTEKQEQLEQAAFELTSVLSDTPRAALSVIVINFHSVNWHGKARGILVFFSAFMQDDNVGLQLSDGIDSSIALKKTLAGKELREVFIHELGHVLGVVHSLKESAIMYKYSDANNLNVKALEEFKKSVSQQCQ